MKTNVLRKACVLAGLIIGLLGSIHGGEIILNLQKSVDGLSGWENVPVTAGQLTGDGAIWDYHSFDNRGHRLLQSG